VANQEREQSDDYEGRRRRRNAAAAAVRPIPMSVSDAASGRAVVLSTTMFFATRTEPSTAAIVAVIVVSDADSADAKETFTRTTDATTAKHEAQIPSRLIIAAPGTRDDLTIDRRGFHR
jgi:hypothetical protein